MRIRALQLHIDTPRGKFGFSERFDSNLTIIRAGNSSGKSTFVNSLLFSLGMEELIGGKGPGTLPYAVREHFEHDGERVEVTSSEVLVEVENHAGDIVTVRRAIRSRERDSKLAEIYFGAHLTTTQGYGVPRPTYLHDPGAAQKSEGFHHFLERFMGLELPRVATSSGGEAKLYLQAIFAALAVEQKRGWTDYIANIPFYGIRDARTRVTEYLLGLAVFESSAARNRLNAEASLLDEAWRTLRHDLEKEARDLGISIGGLPSKISASFDSADVTFAHADGDSEAPLDEFLQQLRNEYRALEARANDDTRVSGAEALARVDTTLEELQRLSGVRDQAASSLTLQRASLREYEGLLDDAKEDLERNKTAAKLRGLGAEHGLELAQDRCPTCHQPVEDTLLMQTATGPLMDLAANIGYLESQCRMLGQQIAGLRESIQQSETKLGLFTARVSAKHDELNALRGDVSSGANLSKAIFRRQVQIESLIARIEPFRQRAGEVLAELEREAQRLVANQLARKSIPKDYYSTKDEASIQYFEKLFRANAQSFGYESAPIKDIEISRDTLVPFLAHLELREIRQSKADIKSDSSASDFVRLIWSYLLSLYQASAHPTVMGNHPAILVFDEPGQHSMAVSSQHELLKRLGAERKLQSIVAASFDESESVFLSATSGVKYKMIEWNGQVIRPLLWPDSAS